jgi:hypothetical protein
LLQNQFAYAKSLEVISVFVFLIVRFVVGIMQFVVWPYKLLSKGGKNGRDVKLTTHLQLLLRSRRMALYLHSTRCLRGVVKHRDNFTNFAISYWHSNEMPSNNAIH